MWDNQYYAEYFFTFSLSDGIIRKILSVVENIVMHLNNFMSNP